MIWARMDVGGPFAPAPYQGGDFPHFKAAEGPPGIPAVLVSFPMLGRWMLTGTICIPGGGRGREGGGADREGADGGGRRLGVLPPSSVRIFWTVWQSAILALTLCLQPLLLRDLPLPLRNLPHLLGNLPLPLRDLLLLFRTLWHPAILAPALALALCLLLRDLPLLLKNLPHLLGNLPLPSRDLLLLLQDLPLSPLLLLLLRDLPLPLPLLLWYLPLPLPLPLRYLHLPLLARCHLQNVCPWHGSLLLFFQ